MRTTTTTRRNERRRSLTVWELPKLLTPMHEHRKCRKTGAVERPHYPAILAFVYRNKYATRCQIQRRFPEHLTSDRTARRHLEELESLGWLGVAPARGVSPLWPKVYYVTGRGVKRLQAAYAEKGKDWQPSQIDRRSSNIRSGFSADHLLHEILLTECLLAVWQTAENCEEWELLQIERRSLASHPSFEVTMAGRRTRLIPDAMYLYRNEQKELQCVFVELDLGTMNRKQLLTKFRRYNAWAKSSLGQQYLTQMYRQHRARQPLPTFRIATVLAGRETGKYRARLCTILKIAARMPASLRRSIWITTAEQLRVYQRVLCPISAVPWINLDQGHRGIP